MDNSIRFYILEASGWTPSSRRGYDYPYAKTSPMGYGSELEYEIGVLDDMRNRMRDFERGRVTTVDPTSGEEVPVDYRTSSEYRQLRTDFKTQEKRVEVIRKEQDYGTHAETFGIFGPKLSKKLSTFKDIADGISAVIHIGSVIVSTVREIARWREEIGEYLRKRRKKRAVDNIVNMAVTLAHSYSTGDRSLKQKVINSIRSNPHIQGDLPLQKIMTAEISLAFHDLGLDTHIQDAVKKTIKRWNHQSIQRLISMSGNTRQLEAEVQEELNNYARNLGKYLKSIKMRRGIESKRGRKRRR